jgi:uncharacterized SAM-binding protein YcdF (DUF218 family)
MPTSPSPTSRSRRPRSTPRAGHAFAQMRGRGMDWKRRLILAAIATSLVLLAWDVAARELAPVSNTALTRFDAIVVLGTTTDEDGNPTPEQIARVVEGVREYERGVAPRLILTGGAASNRFVEAKSMARTAEAQGVPESAIFLEPNSMNTIQNACYAERIMKAHGWKSAEVISGALHLPRAGIIFNSFPIEWRMHVAPRLTSVPPLLMSYYTAMENLKTVRYLIWARWADRCEP